VLALSVSLSCVDEPVRPVSELLAPASAPPVYSDFREVSDLFAQRNDTVYLVNFWATWCKPCLEELPLLQEVQNRYADAPLRVILVSLDDKPEAIARIPDFLERRGVGLPTVVVTDRDEEWQRELDAKWDGSLPTTFIYRDALRYVYRRNFRTLPDILDAVAPLLDR
jgi:thiol-disulfide isomerase/thioredoxin